MKAVISAFFLICAAAIRAAAANPYSVSDPIMAEYEGFWTAASGARGRVTAQIRPLSNNRYDGFILIMRARSPVAAFALEPAVLENGVLNFTGGTRARESGGDLLASSDARAELKNGKLLGTFRGELGEGTFEATRTARTSRTLGAKPPKSALVLFENSKATGWEDNKWTIKNGVLQPGEGNLAARDKLANYHLHLEFRTPYEPLETGQSRGNSGIYLQGKYEVQILDSFGIYPLQDNDCGAIYKVRAPQINASLPPMQWQTFDITYVDAPASGGLPTITVALNGIVVIDHATLPREIASGGTGGSDPSAGFLMLQNHGSPVQFRNIWAEPFFSAAKKR